MKSQKGSSLLFALIILAVMLFGTMSLYSNSLMTTHSTGALSFKENAIKGGDVGVIYAINFLDNLTDLENDSPHYYSVQHKMFNNVPCSKTVNDSDCITDDINWGDPITIEKNLIYFIIERLCSSSNVPELDIDKYCLIDNVISSVTGYGEYNSTSPNLNIFYRITIKVEGSNKTRSYTKLVTTKDI